MTDTPIQTNLTIKPNSFYGYHVKYFIVPGLILFIGNILITILLPIAGIWTLIPALGLLVMGLIDLYIYETRSITLTDTSLIIKKGSNVKILQFNEIKLVRYTERYHFGNNAKAALFIDDTAGSAPIAVVAMSWNHKDIKALYDAIPASVQKQTLERAL